MHFYSVYGSECYVLVVLPAFSTVDVYQSLETPNASTNTGLGQYRIFIPNLDGQYLNFHRAFGKRIL